MVFIEVGLWLRWAYSSEYARHTSVRCTYEDHMPNFRWSDVESARLRMQDRGAYNMAKRGVLVPYVTLVSKLSNF